jgi:hypothetical protein
MTAPVKLAEKRALARRLWNEGDSSHSDIAAATGLTVESAAKWLAKQPGYPGIIGPQRRCCRRCGAEFEHWEPGRRGRFSVYCSAWCRKEAHRELWWRSMRKRKGMSLEDPPRRRQFMNLSDADKVVLEAARREARERGISRDEVLQEWKFVPERSTAREPERDRQAGAHRPALRCAQR